MSLTPAATVRTRAEARSDNRRVVTIAAIALLSVISLRQLLLFTLDADAQPGHYLSEWLIDAIGLVLFLAIVWAARLPSVFGRQRAGRIAVVLVLDVVIRIAVPYLIRGDFPRWFAPELVLVVGVGVGTIVGISEYVDRQRRNANTATALLTEVDVVSTAMDSLKVQQERTRRHISEGLHGSIQQSLVLVEARLRAAAERASDHGHADLATELIDIRSVLAGVREVDVRSLGQLIRPVGIDVGASAALRVLMNRLPPAVQAESDLTERFILVDEGLSMDTRMLVFSAAQEALTNAIKHGNATAVQLSVDVDDAPVCRIRVRFDDNGSGASAAVVKGAGLTHLEHRLTRAGGDLSVARSSALGGMTLTAHVPCAPGVSKQVRAENRANGNADGAPWVPQDAPFGG